MDLIEKNSLKITKISLFIVTIISAIVYIIGFILNRDKIYPFFEKEVKKYDEELAEKLVEIIFVSFIILIVVFTNLILFFIIRESLTGVLTLTIVGIISLLYGFPVIKQTSGPAGVDIIMSIIQIVLGFYYTYLIKKSNAEITAI